MGQKNEIHETNIYTSIYNDVINFKTRIPTDWCEKLNISENEREIFIRYDENEKNLSIEKSDKKKTKLFSDLSKEEKILQINKFKYLYEDTYDKRKDFIKAVEEYFNITYRTAYRYLKELVSNQNELIDTELLEFTCNQNNARNVKVIIIGNTKILTIPSALTILFLEGKTCSELDIKNITEIYSENKNIPIIMELLNNKIIIKKRA